jgi:EF hand
MKIRLLALLAAFTPISFYGYTAPAISPITTLDSDNDGAIDITELGKAASDMFDNLDLDGDGSVDQKEADTRLPTKDFKKADGDADGALTKNEYFHYADDLFRRADADKDGTLDDKEINSKDGKKLIRLII